MEYQRAQIKMAAKQAMKQSRSGPRLTTLLFVVLLGVGTSVLNTIILYASGMNTLSTLMGTLIENAYLGNTDPEYLVDYVLWAMGPNFFVTVIVYTIVSGLLTFILTSLMNAGYNKYCLDIVRRQEPQMSVIFGGFPKTGSVIVTKLLVEVFTFLWLLLFTAALFIVLLVFGLIATAAQSEALALLLVLLVFAGYIGVFVGMVWVRLRYSMVDFLIMDQGMSGLECIRESKRLMQGNVGRLFVLQLSFIGWYLLQGFLALVGGISIYGVAFAAIRELSRIGGLEPGFLIGFCMLGMVSLITYVVSLAVSIWLKPYVTGSVALFYDWARGAAPVPAAPQNWSAGGQNFHYTWTDGQGGSGTGIGGGSRSGGSDGGWGSGGWGGSQGGSAPGAGQSGGWGGGPSTGSGGPGPNGGGQPDIPAPKQPPRDDPWA